MRVVYIEDDENNAYMLARRLRRIGFDVSTASDGAVGLELVRALRPDLVLMDLGLPSLDGWEVTRRIKADSDLAGIPVIAVSSHAMQGHREAALAAGCDDYDTKPIDFQRLLGKIAASLPRMPNAASALLAGSGTTTDS